MNFKKVVGDRLRSARKAAGFKNQSDFAAKLGVDESRVSRWESGQNTPDPAFRKLIHELLGTTEEALFDARFSLEDQQDLDHDSLVSEFVRILPTLEKNELSALLSTARTFPSQRPGAKRSSR